MSINLSGSINTLLPGTKPLPPPNLLFWKNTWLQQSEAIPGKKPQTNSAERQHPCLWIQVAMGFSTVTWSPPMAGAMGVCPLLPTRLRRTQRILKPLYWKWLWETAGQKEGKAPVLWPTSMSPATSLLPGQATQKPDRQLPAETGCGATGSHRTLVHWRKKRSSRQTSKAFYFYHDEKVSSCSSNECEHFRKLLVIFTL